MTCREREREGERERGREREREREESGERDREKRKSNLWQHGGRAENGQVAFGISAGVHSGAGGVLFDV